jgi:hypothetical protein
MGVQGFRDSLRAVVPKWLQDRPALRTGFQLLYVCVGMFDRGVQALLEGSRAQLPGSDGRTDSLAMVGQSRMRLQGETETDAHFSGVTLLNWLADLRGLGDDAGLAKELNRWLAGNPMVRVISRQQPASPLNPNGWALYTTCAANGTVTQTYAAWDWDSVSNPERNVGGPGSVGRFDYWIVVYPMTATGYPASGYVATTGHWGDGQGPNNSGRGIGLSNTNAEAQVIRSLITTWNGAHVTPRCLIASYDDAAFDPATPGRSGNPNGTWGRFVNISTCLAARNRTHRYMMLGPNRP